MAIKQRVPGNKMKYLLPILTLLFISTAYADPGCNTRMLVWDGVDGAVGYFIYWRDNSSNYDNERRIYVGNTNGHPFGDYLPPPENHLLLESGDKILLSSGDSLMRDKLRTLR